MPKIRMRFPKGDMDDSPPAAAAGKRNASKRKFAGDTIEVKHKLAAVALADSDEGIGTRKSRRRSSNRRISVGEPNGSWGRKGKASARVSVLDVIDSDDAVEEYVFSNEEEDVEDDEDDLDDSKSIITVSSESVDEPEEGLSLRPWSLFDEKGREQWEFMYANVTTYPIGGNWEATEDFQREKDTEMLKYLEDFPLNQWVIPEAAATQAYWSLIERTRWRSLGIRIYGRQRIPAWIPDSTAAPQGQQSLDTSRNEHPREAQLDRVGHEQPRPRESIHPHEEPRPGEPRKANEGPIPHSGPTPSRQEIQPQIPPHQHQQLPNHSLPQQDHPHALHHQAHPSISGHAGRPDHLGSIPGPHAGPHPPPHGPFSSHAGPHGPPPGPHLHPPPPPPPQHAMQSQLFSQVMPIHPGGYQLTPSMVFPPQQMPYQMGLDYAHPHHYSMQQPFPAPAAPRPRRGRDKKESPTQNSPPPPAPTPPYVLRQKPVDKKGTKAGRRSARKQAEAEEFPWTRALNFKEEKEKATWDDSIYDSATLEIGDATRARNAPIIEELDAKVLDQQRIARAAKKDKEKSSNNVESSDAEARERGQKKKLQRGNRKVDSGGDPYHSGAFAFASDEDEKKAADLGFKTPDEALEAGEAGKLDSKAQASIKIYWNPGKKGMTENLEQIKFTVKDTLVTRAQVAKTPVLTKRAAECIVDFCPDMLWRGMLLRICSEAGRGNKDVRDRFCNNGCYCDKATITKRISAALGQKQVQPKSKGYGPGEWEWYDENVKDFAKYIDFFGKRTSHRNALKIQIQGEKRKLQQRVPSAGAAADAESSDEEKAVRRKRPKLASDSVDGEEEHESDGSEDSNAVSAQDSDILDKMED